VPERIIPILARLRQDVARPLAPETIRDACRQVGHRWRERLLDPVTTIHLFLLQVLHGNTACRHVVHFGGWAFTDAAYCQARKRLPLAVYERLVEATAAAVRDAGADLASWLGHRVWVVDGSSFSMPDTPGLQAAFGQPGSQRPGCGFPVARWLALFDVATGMLLRSSIAPLRSHEMASCAAISDDLGPGDIVLGDRGFCSYAHVALLAGRGLHALFRAHQKQIVDFTPGRPHTDRESRGLPRSRWILAYGPEDQRVAWRRPGRGPSWMSAEAYAALPAEVLVREVRYRIATPGYRTHTITLVTTLLDAPAYPASALAELYLARWQVEIDFRHMKIGMKMEVLRSETVEGVRKELAMYALAYNLVRSAMVESSRRQGVTPDRIGLVDAVRWLLGPESDADVDVLVVNPSRRGRVEPRVTKRRPKPHVRMMRPRADLRKQLMRQ
jgi:hypothetical protein